MAYSQGLAQIAEASNHYEWDIDLAKLAQTWRAGCIIRARLLDSIACAFEKEPKLPILLADDFFAQELTRASDSWRQAVSWAVRAGVGVPALASALGYLDQISAPVMTTNIIQAQRDYFGAHTFNRVDKPGTFHHQWLGS